MAYVVFCRAVGTAQVLGVLWIGRTAGCEAATSVRHLVEGMTKRVVHLHQPITQKSELMPK